MFYRRTGDDAAIIILILNLRERAVKCGQMILRGVLADMAGHVQKFHVHLKRRIAEQPQELTFRHNFFRHEIEHKNAQRTDILMYCTICVHHKNIFLRQRLKRRQLGRNTNWHRLSSFLKKQRLPPISGFVGASPIWILRRQFWVWTSPA